MGMFKMFTKKKDLKSDYIDEIKELALKGETLGCWRRIGGRKNLFDKVATMKEIKKFETEMGITLPKPFVRYLTELGNGGVGPGYGIYSLDEIRKVKPCVGKPMLDHSLSNIEWRKFSEKYETLFNKVDFVSDEEAEIILKELSEMEHNMIAGGIIIGTPGCTMYTVLMLCGNAAGEVFIVDFDYMDQIYEEPWCGGLFEDWMINSMKKSIEKAVSKKNMK